MLTVILAIAYVVIVYLSWRKVPLSQPRKAIFSLTVLPLFFGSMFLNIWLIDTFLPELIDAFNASHAHAEELIKQGVRGRGVRREEAGMAFLVSVPLAALISACWFLLFRRLERHANIRKGTSS